MLEFSFTASAGASETLYENFCLEHKNIKFEFQENINNEKNCRKQNAHSSSSLIGIILNECHFKNDDNFLFDMLDDFHFEIAFQIYFGLILDLSKGAHFEITSSLSFRDN